MLPAAAGVAAKLAQAPPGVPGTAPALLGGHSACGACRALTQAGSTVGYRGSLPRHACPNDSSGSPHRGTTRNSTPCGACRCSTWREIRDQEAHSRRKSDRKHKYVPRDHLTAKAQRRLEALELDDFDELFRFRLGNTERLWGVLPPDNPRVFYPIWWDPDHKICP
jgi:hypothetical protein